MKIPIPCNFGEYAKCKNRQLPFVGVTWFHWTQGWEYTYFFKTNDTWHDIDFYNTFQKEQPFYFEIEDNLLCDMFIKDRGFPLKGRGYAYGIYYENGKRYIEFILSSNYLAHIKVQCDENGQFVPDGDIIFPLGWDEEKKKKVLLKSVKYNGEII